MSAEFKITPQNGPGLLVAALLSDHRWLSSCTCPATGQAETMQSHRSDQGLLQNLSSGDAGGCQCPGQDPATPLPTPGTQTRSFRRSSANSSRTVSAISSTAFRAGPTASSAAAWRKVLASSFRLMAMSSPTTTWSITPRSNAQFQDGAEYSADVIGTDPKTDLALLKIKTDKTLPFRAFRQ